MKERAPLLTSSRIDNTQAETLPAPPRPWTGGRRSVLLGLYLGLGSLVLLFGYRYWLDPHHGRRQIAQLQAAVAAQRAENGRLEARNQGLERDIASLRNGHEGLEERARNELGMIRSGETFVQLVGGATGNPPVHH